MFTLQQHYEERTGPQQLGSMGGVVQPTHPKGLSRVRWAGHLCVHTQSSRAQDAKKQEGFAIKHTKQLTNTGRMTSRFSTSKKVVEGQDTPSHPKQDLAYCLTADHHYKSRTSPSAERQEECQEMFTMTQTKTKQICRDIYIYIYERYPTIHLYPGSELPHYPRESYPIIHVNFAL